MIETRLVQDKFELPGLLVCGAFPSAQPMITFTPTTADITLAVDLTTSNPVTTSPSALAVNSTGGAITITLPVDPPNGTKVAFRFDNLDNTVTFDPGLATIDNEAGLNEVDPFFVGNVITMCFDAVGSQWNSVQL